MARGAPGRAADDPHEAPRHGGACDPFLPPSGAQTLRRGNRVQRRQRGVLLLAQGAGHPGPSERGWPGAQTQEMEPGGEGLVPPLRAPVHVLPRCRRHGRARHPAVLRPAVRPGHPLHSLRRSDKPDTNHAQAGGPRPRARRVLSVREPVRAREQCAPGGQGIRAEPDRPQAGHGGRRPVRGVLHQEGQGDAGSADRVRRPRLREGVCGAAVPLPCLRACHRGRRNAPGAGGGDGAAVRAPLSRHAGEPRGCRPVGAGLHQAPPLAPSADRPAVGPWRDGRWTSCAGRRPARRRNATTGRRLRTATRACSPASSAAARLPRIRGNYSSGGWRTLSSA